MKNNGYDKMTKKLRFEIIVGFIGLILSIGILTLIVLALIKYIGS